MSNLSRLVSVIFITLVCGLTALKSSAQAIYNGQVLDKTTEEAIPGVTVKLAKEQKATSTSARGYFKLTSEQEVPGDSLIFSSIGYKTYRLAITDYQRGLLVELEPSTTELKNVNITNRKIITNTLSSFTGGDIRYSVKNVTQPFSPGTTYAKYFKAKKPNGKITTIYLGLRQFDPPARGGYRFVTPNLNTRFNIHILSYNKTTKQPEKTLFSKTISLSEDILKLTIDLTNDDWTIEDTQFFIAVEWLKIPVNEAFILSRGDVVKRTTAKGEQKLDMAPMYYMMRRPFLVMMPYSSHILSYMMDSIPATATEPARGIWSDCSKMRNIALAATVTY